MSTPPRARRASALTRRATAALACVSTGALLALAPMAMGVTATSTNTGAIQGGAGTAIQQTGQGGAPIGKADATATLEQCATATIPQTERSATFAAEMTAIPGSARMELRIDLEERAPGEALYRTVTAPGLGVWHSSAAGVKVFGHIQQVTDLSAPALYRGAVRFRWLGAKGRPIKTVELRTAHCEQPATPAPSETTTTTTSTTTTTATTTAPTGASPG
jgi:hypothetical protein